MDWGQFGLNLMATLLPILAMVLTAFASWGLQILAKKWGLQLDLEKDAAVRMAVRTAIGGAEEWAARKLMLDDDVVDGADKAKWVHQQVTALWPKLIPDGLDRMIDEELSLMYDVGATQKTMVGFPVGVESSVQEDPLSDWTGTAVQ